MILIDKYNGNKVAEKVGIAIALYLLGTAFLGEERLLQPWI